MLFHLVKGVWNRLMLIYLKDEVQLRQPRVVNIKPKHWPSYSKDYFAFVDVYI